jgi:hypothetical protein
VVAARGLERDRVRLEFLTPAFVKFRGEVSPEAPSFAALVQNLLIRLPMLCAVHCGEIWRDDFRALIERAKEVETVMDETTWASFRRHSSFKNKVELLEGVVGRAEYAGPLEEFLPLLCMGQIVHVGKRDVFGLGRYRIIPSWDEHSRDDGDLHRTRTPAPLGAVDSRSPLSRGQAPRE